MKNTITIFLLSLTAIFYGCHATQNLTVGDIRTQEHFYKQVEIKMSLAEIRQSIYQFVTTCRPLGDFHVDPNNNREAQMIFSAPGFSAMSAIVVMDFSEQADKSTSIKSYSFYSSWHSQIEVVLNAINQPKKC